MSDAIGTYIGDKYEIIAADGRGRDSLVYRALHHPIDRVVTLEILDPSRLGSAKARGELTRRARALAGVIHNGVATLYDYGEHCGRPYLVRAFVPGATLRVVTRREAPVTVRRALALGIQLAEATAAVHRAGIVMGALHPDLIQVYRDASGEHLVITDLAAAGVIGQRVEPQAIGGERGYVAPERMHGGASDARVDVYTLGAILYELLAGRSRVDDLDPLPIDPRLDVPARFEDLVLRALRRNPTSRPASAEAVLATLRALLEEHGDHDDNEPTLIDLAPPPDCMPYTFTRHRAP